MSRLRTVSVVLMAGVVLGLVSRASDLLPRELGWVGNLGAVWLAVAFGVGASLRVPAVAAVAGSTTLTLASLVHYTSARLLRHGIAIDLLRFPVPQWIVIGTLTGALFGLIGAAWRQTGWRNRAVAALAASFGAEAVYLFERGGPNAIALAAPLEIAAFLTIPLILARRARDGLVSTAWSFAMTPFGAAVILGIVAVARRVY